MSKDSKKDAKDSFWFKHDYDPTGDLKAQSMLNEFGATGYGIYWRIAEILHVEKDHRLPFKNYIYSAIAKQMNANAQQMLSNADQTSANKFKIDLLPTDVEYFIKRCINEHELFKSDDDGFWSERVNRNIDDKKRVSEIRSKSGSSKGKGNEDQANDSK